MNLDRLMSILALDTTIAYFLLNENTHTCYYVSPGAENVLGFSLDELRGKTPEEALDIAHAGENLRKKILTWDHTEVLDTGRFEYVPDQGSLPKGVKKYLRCKCFPPDEGEIVIALVDETAQERQELALREAMISAEAANKAKSEFLSNMSHDVRTPMNAVMGFAQLLEMNAADPDRTRNYARNIMTASQNMMDLFNSVLDMSRIESGKMALHVVPFDLQDVVSEIEEIMRPQAEEKHQQFTVSVQDACPSKLVGDRMYVSRVLFNLLTNAVKYTPDQGKVELRVSGRLAGDKTSWCIHFEVADNGLGMSADFLPVIFQPYTREQSVHTSAIPGTGLGMAITKNLLDLMGGSISVISELGEGSTFTVLLCLPIAPVS